MKKVYIGIFILGAIVVGAFFLLQKETNTEPAEVLGEPTATIVRTDAGYVPNEVTIQKGDIILWTNESREYHWPASDLHPTHGVYPAFDPLRAIAPGDEWKFQFGEVGKWKFHDHIRANVVGTVTVTE